MILVFLWLILFSIMFSRLIHIVACIRKIILFMAEYFMYILHFVYLFVDRHLGCFSFWLLEIMLLWILVYYEYWCIIFIAALLISVKRPFFQYLKVELLDHMLILYIAFWGTTKLFLYSSCSVLHFLLYFYTYLMKSILNKSHVYSTLWVMKKFLIWFWVSDFYLLMIHGMWDFWWFRNIIMCVRIYTVLWY